MPVVAHLGRATERPAASLGRLREKLRATEAAAGLAGQDSRPLALGIAEVDDLLGGGLLTGALHEIAAAHEADTPAATGFALALASICRADQPVAKPCILWVAEDLSLAENGQPYGPGLDDAAIAPERLIVVHAARAHDVLWTVEEALRCRSLAAVIGELRAHAVDQVATRRLALAAAAGNTLGLLLRTLPDGSPCAAATRWIIAAAAAVGEGGRSSLGPPRLAAQLVRNRRGGCGSWMLEWYGVEQRFRLATVLEPVAGAAFDRPSRAHPG